MSQTSQWVTVKDIHEMKNGKGEVYTTTRPGDLGLIHKVDDDGGIYICFPHTHTSFKIRELAPFPLPNFDDAIQVLKDANGHHCSRVNAYQFNIKFHEFPDNDLFKKYGENEVWRQYNDILSDQLRSFMGDDCDEGLMQVIPWAKKWHTAGRSGGWLVIETDGDSYHWESMQSDYDEAKIALQQNFHKQQSEDEWNKYLDEVIDRTQSMALSILYIEACIKHAHKGLAEFINSDEPWQELEEESEDDDEEDILDFEFESDPRSDDGEDDYDDDGAPSNTTGKAAQKDAVHQFS